MTRARKTTSLSVKDFDRQIGGESVDTGTSHVTLSPHSLVKHTVFFSQTSPSPKTRKASSLHHRLFSRSSTAPGQREEENDPSLDVVSETTPFTPRKTMMMTGWPFSRSTSRKNGRPTEDSEHTSAAPGTSRFLNVKDPGSGIQVSSHSSPYFSVTSYAPISTSSLGSLVPTHERMFHRASRDLTDEQTSPYPQYSNSSRVHVYAPPPTSSRAAVTTPSDPILSDGDYGARDNCNRHQDQVSRASEPKTRTSSELVTEEDTSSRRSVVGTTRPKMLDEDPTPRTEMFDQLVAISLPVPVVTAATKIRGRGVQCLDIDVLALRPAVGVTPHVPSETESFSTSACSASPSSPPTSPIKRDSFPAAFPVMKPSSDTDAGTFASPVLPSTTPRVVTISPDSGSSRSNFNCSPDSVAVASSASSMSSPRSRKRAISRSLTPPPLPRPPPKGPLPPVPPLPPLLNKFPVMNVNVPPHAMIPSLSRPSTITGAAANAGTAALPPSPPGALRLPSRLSWINSVRAVLPSPPASPTKKAKTLSIGDKPSSSSRAEKKQFGERPRPTSISIIEATEDRNGDNEVRRTKSILLLGSRSKSNMSLGTKRVQIHADVNGDSDVGGDGINVGVPSTATMEDASVSAPTLESTSLRKQKRKSSSSVPTLGLNLGLGCPSVFSSSRPYSRVPSLPVRIPTTNSCREEVAVFPLERRHSAPLFSTFDLRKSADWTLSLPFSTDVPGNKILLSSSSEPQLKSPEKEEEDWTLCMPLKLRAVDIPVHKLCDGDGEECVSVDTSDRATAEEEEETTVMQLPTPSPSPTCSTPRSIVVPLDPMEEQENEDKEEIEESALSVVEPENRPASPASSLGPHVGGLDLVSGRGKRASGWHVYGWFDEVRVDEDVAAVPESRFIKNHVSAFRKNDSSSGARHPSQDSIMSSVASTMDTVFYSARSSWLVN